MLRACYIGFERGFLAELFHLVVVVSATVLACNFHGVVSGFVATWWQWNPSVLNCLSFLLLLGVGLFVGRLLLLALTNFLKWERLHWIVQGLGLMLGGLRGLWWAGLLLLLLLATGVPYLKDSIEERAVFGPRLASVAKDSLEFVADWYPGHAKRAVLVPALEVELPKLFHERE